MARTAEQIQADIDRLRKARVSGVRRVTVDGQSTEFASDEDMRRNLAELQSELSVANGEQNLAKPRFINVNLGSCM